MQIMQKIKSIETNFKGEISDLKRTTSQCVKKTDSIEKEMRAMKAILEDMQKAGGGGSGNGATKHSSSDVSSTVH